MDIMNEKLFPIIKNYKIYITSDLIKLSTLWNVWPDSLGLFKNMSNIFTKSENAY